MPIVSIPNTIALIPDGNRRWAKMHRLSFFNGYRLGVRKFIDFSEWCKDYGIRNITVWAFSTENFNRPKNEVNVLFDIYRKTAKDKKLIERLHENKTRFNIIGNRSILPKDLMAMLHKIEVDTMHYTDRVINMLIGYGGRDDIAYAVKKIAHGVATGRISSINEQIIRENLISHNVPDIDYIIRTSGEERLSGFMPWQAGYAELYFSRKLWPDFTKADLNMALLEYSRRQRRFGK